MAELREALRAAEEEEASCEAKVAEYGAKLDAARAAFGKPLQRLALQREALDAKLGALEEARRTLREQTKERRSKSRLAAARRQQRLDALAAMRDEYGSVRQARAARKGAARLLQRLLAARRAWEAAEAKAMAEAVPWEAEVAAVRARLESASAAAAGHAEALRTLREGFKASALQVPALHEAKKRAVEGRNNFESPRRS